MKGFIQELNEFYPSYLRAHSNMGNQVLHFIGASLFFTFMAMAFILPGYWLIAVAIAAGYLFPGLGHRFFQHNESFRTSKPILCVLCAFRLYIDTITLQVHKKSKRAYKAE